MNRVLPALCAVVLSFFSLMAAAQVPQAPEVAARSYLLLDVSANQILAEKDIDSPVEPASLTKLMTAYLVFDALRSKKLTLAQTLPVSERAWKMPGSRMFIDPKMQVPVEDLIKGLIVQSGNDATMALAEGVGGTAERFVQLMNEQAKALGMKATSYKNPEGLTEPGHTTTARDLSVLATRLMHDFPEYIGYYAIKKYRYPGTPGSRRLLSIVLGTTSENVRANESQKLLNWGFTAYEGVKLFDAGQAVVTPAVWKGKEATVKLGRTQPIIVAVPAGEAAKLKTQVVRPDPLVAPLAKGQQVGSLKVLSGTQTVAEVPLVALDGVEQAGVFGRAWDAIRLWIK